MKTLFLFIFLISNSLATVLPPKGKVTTLNGNAQREDMAGKKEKLQLNSQIFEGDTIVTEDKTQVKITLEDKSEINLGPKSKLKLEDLDATKNKPSALWLVAGSMRAKVTKAFSDKPKVIVKSRGATMGIRGTDLQVVSNPTNGNSSLVTLEGQVVMNKSQNATEPTMNTAQAAALSQVAKVAIQSLEKQTPFVFPKTLQQVDQAAREMEKSLSSPLTTADQKALSDTTKLISNQLQPTLTPAEIKSFYEVATAAEAQTQLTPEQSKAIEAIKSLASSASDKQNTQVSVEQAQALAKVEKLAVENLKPESLPDTLKADLSKVDSLGAKFESADKLKPEQVEALKDIKTITTSTTAGTKQMTAEQALAFSQLSTIADQVIESDKLSPVMKSQLEKTTALSENTADKTSNITSEQAESISKLHQMSAISQTMSGKTLDLSIEQSAALFKATNLVQDKVDSNKISTEVKNAMTSIDKMEERAPQVSKMSSTTIQELKEVQVAVNESIKTGMPLEVNPALATSMQETQKLALSVAKPELLTPAEKIAIAVNDKVTQAIVADATTPPAPITELTQNLNDTTKTVAVSEGQFSGVSAAQDLPSSPVKVAPTQFEAMKNNSGVAGVTSGNTQATVASTTNTQTSTSIVSTTTGKPLISPIPPGIDAKTMIGSNDELNKTAAKLGFTVETPVPTAKPLTQSANADVPALSQAVPPAGGFVDMNTGAYIAPPPGSTYDSVAGVYVPPPSMGNFDTNSGAYVPPPGFVLDASKGFVNAQQFYAQQAAFATAPATTAGATPTTGTIPGSNTGGISTTNSNPALQNQLGFDPSAALAGIPQNIGISSATTQMFANSAAATPTNPQNNPGFQTAIANNPAMMNTIGGMFMSAGYVPPVPAATFQADMANMSGGSLFAGMAPTTFNAASMAAAPPPPGYSPGTGMVAPTFAMNANNAYMPTDFVPPTYNPVAAAGPNSPANTPGAPTPGGALGTGTGMVPGGVNGMNGMNGPAGLAPGAMSPGDPNMMGGGMMGGGMYGMGAPVMGFGNNGGLIMGGGMMSGGMMGGGMMGGGMYGGYDPMMGGMYIPNYNNYTMQPTYPVYDPYACSYSGSCNTGNQNNNNPPPAGGATTSVTITIN